MNRRSFFRSVASAVAGVYFGCHVKAIELPGIMNVTKVNTEWINAPYEVNFLIQKRVFTSSPWEDLIKGGQFPKGMGETIRFSEKNYI
jgi:hypothetical protein